MSVSLVLWFCLAVCLFWLVGLYNRLMRMRARALDAFGSVEKHARQYAPLVRAHLTDAASHPIDPDYLPVDWVRLVAALDELDMALKEARRSSFAAHPFSVLTAVLHKLQENWSILLNMPADLAGPTIPVPLSQQWDEVAKRVLVARGGFNQILVKYNDAIAQFPARLVVGLFGFKTAGLL